MTRKLMTLCAILLAVGMFAWGFANGYKLGKAHGTTDATAQHRAPPPKAIRPLAPRP